jgi:hypothetical protein
VTTPRYTPATWIDAYVAAWSGRDDRLAADLFSEDVIYVNDPFGAPLIGRDTVVSYWRAAISQQEDIDLHARVVVEGAGRAAAEWWVTFRRDRADVTLSASLLLSFDEHGRCTELHEHWLQWNERQPAPEWFTRNQRPSARA